MQDLNATSFMVCRGNPESPNSFCFIRDLRDNKVCNVSLGSKTT